MKEWLYLKKIDPVQEFRGNNPPYTFATDILVFFM